MQSHLSVRSYLLFVFNHYLRFSVKTAYKTSDGNMPVGKVPERIPAEPSRIPTIHYYCEILVWIGTSDVEEILVSALFVPDIVNLSINPCHFSDVIVCIVCRDGMDPVTVGIVPEIIMWVPYPVFVVHMNIPVNMYYSRLFVGIMNPAVFNRSVGIMYRWYRTDNPVWHIGSIGPSLFGMYG